MQVKVISLQYYLYFLIKKSKKWDDKTLGANKWETLFSNDNMVFIPAKEVLSNNYNLAAAVERGNVRFDILIWMCWQQPKLMSALAVMKKAKILY